MQWTKPYREPKQMNMYKRLHTLRQASERKEYMNKANSKTIWQVKKYVTNIPTTMFVPTLDGQAAMNEQKVAILRKPSSLNCH